MPEVNEPVLLPQEALPAPNVQGARVPNAAAGEAGDVGLILCCLFLVGLSWSNSCAQQNRLGGYR